MLTKTSLPEGTNTVSASAYARASPLALLPLLFLLLLFLYLIPDALGCCIVIMAIGWFLPGPLETFDIDALVSGTRRTPTQCGSKVVTSRNLLASTGLSSSPSSNSGSGSALGLTVSQYYFIRFFLKQLGETVGLCTLTQRRFNRLSNARIPVSRLLLSLQNSSLLQGRHPWQSITHTFRRPQELTIGVEGWHAAFSSGFATLGDNHSAVLIALLEDKLEMDGFRVRLSTPERRDGILTWWICNVEKVEPTMFDCRVSIA